MYIINQKTSFGEEERSPDFAPEIKIKFTTDMSAEVKAKIIKLNKEIKDSKDEEQIKKNEEVTQKLGELMFKNYVLDWNLHTDEATKLEVSPESVDKYFSTKLSAWLQDQFTSFFTKPVQK